MADKNRSEKTGIEKYSDSYLYQIHLETAFHPYRVYICFEILNIISKLIKINNNLNVITTFGFRKSIDKVIDTDIGLVY